MERPSAVRGNWRPGRWLWPEPLPSRAGEGPRPPTGARTRQRLAPNATRTPISRLTSGETSQLKVPQVETSNQKEHGRHAHQQQQGPQVFRAQRSFAARCGNKLHLRVKNVLALVGIFGRVANPLQIRLQRLRPAGCRVGLFRIGNARQDPEPENSILISIRRFANRHRIPGRESRTRSQNVPRIGPLRGSHTSGADPCTTPEKRSGATPITTMGTRLRMAFMPITERTEPNLVWAKS